MLATFFSIYPVVAKCYYLSLNQLDWREAQSFCQQNCNSDLASIHSDDDYQTLIDLIKHTTGDTVTSLSYDMNTYIGLTHPGDNQWSWSDGTPFDFGNVSTGEYPWVSGNPDENTVIPVCVYLEGIDYNYRWNDASCVQTDVIFACNHCDSVVNKFVTPDIREGRYESASRCQNVFGTELASFHSERDLEEAVRICTFINAQNSITTGVQGDVTDECYHGLFAAADIWEWDDGTSFDFANVPCGDYWAKCNTDYQCSCFDHDLGYKISHANCAHNRWSICNMPSELCYNDKWSLIIGNSLYFQRYPCTVYVMDNDYMIINTQNRWDNHGNMLVFEYMYSINSTEASSQATAGIVWHIDGTCSTQYYYIGISYNDNSVFVAQVKDNVVNIIQSVSLSFTYTFGTFYLLRAEISSSNTFSLAVNGNYYFQFVSGSSDFNAVDPKIGYIGIKNTGTEVIAKSLFVSGAQIVETDNDASTWFKGCVPTSATYTSIPTTTLPTSSSTAKLTTHIPETTTKNPTIYPTTLPSENPSEPSTSTVHSTTSIMSSSTPSDTIRVSTTITPIDAVTKDGYESYDAVSEITDAADLAFPVLAGVFVFFVPICFSLTAYTTFHRKRRGSDRPSYSALFKFFGNIADLYSDIWWSLMLMSQNFPLWSYAMFFTFGSHIVSVIVGVFFLLKWRQDHTKLYISGYADKYDKLLIFGIVTAGFYATAEIITSHLFHLNSLSLQLSTKEKAQINNIKLVNHVILENAPILLIQCLYLTSLGVDVNHLNSTLVTMFFSVTSLIFCSLTLTEKCCNKLITSVHSKDLTSVFMQFEIKQLQQDVIKNYHIHTHYVLSRALAIALELQQCQINVSYSTSK